MRVKVLSWFFAACCLASVSTASAMPIWDLLTYEEKMGRILYSLMHLVGDYCRNAEIPDCRKVLMLYGVSSLMNQSDKNLEQLDPYQKESLQAIWQSAYKSSFKFPSSSVKAGSRTLSSILFGLEEFDEDVERPPTKFLAPNKPERTK